MTNDEIRHLSLIGHWAFDIKHLPLLE